MSSADKAPDAFRTISEVAEDLDLPQHVLRFWETRFGQIRPMKRGGGRRFYRPEDVDLLRGIKHLLYGEGYTIKGVQRILKSQGQRFVQSVWRDPASLAAAVERAGPLNDEGEGGDEVGRVPAYAPDDEPAAERDLPPPLGTAAHPTPAPAHGVPAPVTAPSSAPSSALSSAPWQAPRPAAPQPHPRGGVDQRPLPAPDAAPAVAHGRLTLRPPEDEPAVPGGGLSREELRRLKVALYELVEARRLLDDAR